MEHDENIPGVTFRLLAGNQLPPPPGNPQIIAMGEVTLSAEITDIEMWGEVLKKLDCLRIYTTEDLAEEMVNVAQKKARAAEKQLQQAEEVRQGQLEALRQRISFLSAENNQLRVANQQWVTWYEKWRAQQPGVPNPQSGL